MWPEWSKSLERMNYVGTLFSPQWDLERISDSVYFEIGSAVNSTETEGGTLATEKPSAKSAKL